MMRLVLLTATVLLAGPAFGQADVTGFAISLDNGEPLEGVRVVLKTNQGLDIPGREVAVTDADGHYILTDVAPNEYILAAVHEFVGEGGTRIAHTLLSRPVVLPDDGPELHFGFSQLGLRADQDLSDAMEQGDKTERDGNVVMEGVSDWWLVRARFLRSSIRNGRGQEVIDLWYPDRPRSSD